MNQINIVEVMNKMVESGMSYKHSLIFGDRVRWLFQQFGVEKVMTTKNDVMRYAIDNLALKPFYEILTDSDFSDITEVTDEMFAEHKSIYNYYLVMHVWISILTEESKNNKTKVKHMSNTTTSNPLEGGSNQSSETNQNHNSQPCFCGSGKPQNECCGNSNLNSKGVQNA